MQKKNFLKVFSAILYALPVVFFVVCYFLIVTSGEDIFQGANTPANIFEDAVAAFNHSARLGDVYAWSVINLFDYTFSFGVDTIFRLIDVFSAVLIFYLTTFIVLGRKPGLNLKDALIFGLAFLMVILTPHGRILYAGFSAIHNYLIMMVFLLLFATPFFVKIRKPDFSFPKCFPILMAVLGVLFGMSSNIAPLAVLVTGIVVGGFLLIVKKVKFEKKFFLSWQFFGFFGVLLGILISFFVGPGLSNYLDNPDYIPTYDYLAFSDLFINPISEIITIIKHMVANFGRVLLPILVFGVPVVIFYLFCRKSSGYQKKKLSDTEKNVLIVVGIFSIIFVCGNFQLNSPIRALLPGYFGAVICFLVVLKHIFDNFLSEKIFWIFSGILAVAIISVTTIRLFLSVDYLSRMTVILDKIREADSEVCVTPEEIHSKTLPFVYLGQEDMLADWAMPETVYGKSVGFCEKVK